MSTLLYNPDKKNKQQFIEEFVVRTSVFEEIFNDIQTGKMKTPEQHYLLVGQRGSGKTTLLNRLKYAIEDDSKLNKWLIPIIFNEEQYHIIELVNIWENIASYLEDFYGFTGLTKEIEKHITKKEFEQITLDIVVKALNKEGKKIVLFLDNIGDLFKKFDELEIRRLREILQTIPHIRLVAGSPVVLESLTDYHQPLFEFFKVVQLKGLTNEETIFLLRKLADLNHQTKKIDSIINKTPSRIEILRTLSGGVPRTIALLFMVFIDDEHGNSLTDLEKVLDMVTPLYKHRMDDLPTQQQKIVDAVAKNWDAISVKELSEILRLESKVISAQLRQLEKNQIIEKRNTDTKNHIYLIRERFFNIWYLMRYGRKQDRQRVIWLVKFLELWCDGKEIEKRILKYIEKSKQGLIDSKTHELYGEAYSFFEKIKPETKLMLKGAAPKYVSTQIEITDDDFDKLVSNYYKKKDWVNFIKVSLETELTLYKKNKVFSLIEDNNDLKLDKLIRKNIDLIFEENKNIDAEISEFYFLYMFHRVTNYPHIEESDDEIQMKFNLVNSLYNTLNKTGYITEFEENCINLYMIELLCFKQYQLALSFFKEKDNLKKSLKQIYILIQYYIKNQDINILNKYGTEMKESVLLMSKRLSKIQNKVIEFQKEHK